MPLTFSVQIVNARPGTFTQASVTLIGLLDLLNRERDTLRPGDSIILTVEPPHAE